MPHWNHLHRHVDRMASYTDVPYLSFLAGLLGGLQRASRPQHPLKSFRVGYAMELPEVDIVSVQSLEALLQLPQSSCLVPHIRFCGNDHLLAAASNCLAKAFLAGAISGCGIDQVDPQVQGSMDYSYRLFLRWAGDRYPTDPDPGYLKPCLAKSHSLHYAVSPNLYA